MYLSLPLLALSLLDLASAVNLFPNGAKGRLLGSTFGVPGANATFDYVVVGGGTAGITIATRLSATGARVALVEAGGFYEIDNGNYSTVPGYATFFTGSDPTNFQPGIDWGISTVPQPVRHPLSALSLCVELTCNNRVPLVETCIMHVERRWEGPRRETTCFTNGMNMHTSREEYTS